MTDTYELFRKIFMISLYTWISMMILCLCVFMICVFTVCFREWKANRKKLKK